MPNVGRLFIENGRLMLLAPAMVKARASAVLLARVQATPSPKRKGKVPSDLGALATLQAIEELLLEILISPRLITCVSLRCGTL